MQDIGTFARVCCESFQHPLQEWNMWNDCFEEVTAAWWWPAFLQLLTIASFWLNTCSHLYKCWQCMFPFICLWVPFLIFCRDSTLLTVRFRHKRKHLQFGKGWEKRSYVSPPRCIIRNYKTARDQFDVNLEGPLVPQLSCSICKSTRTSPGHDPYWSRYICRIFKKALIFKILS